MENVLRSGLESGSFVYAAELVLGRDHDQSAVETFVSDASQEPNGIKIISATDLPGGNVALPPEAFISYVTEHGLTSVAHLSGKDGNRSSLESRLHSLARMGSENILALTGDAHKDAFAGKAKPVYDLDSVLILTLIDQARRGLEYSMGPRTLQTTPFDFLAGAVVSPYKVGEPDQMMQYYKLRLKVAAGAQFIVTQLGYNLRKLWELRQYMVREGLGHVPVIANVYVATATVAKMMRRGDIAGCVVPDGLVTRLEGEKKPQRLERAALLLAAVRGLGFAGAHIGGFGITHKDVMKMVDRSHEIGDEWRAKMDELVFEYPDEFYLFRQGSDGLSDDSGPYLTGTIKSRKSLQQRLSGAAHRVLGTQESPGGRMLSPAPADGGGSTVDGSWRKGLRYRLLNVSDLYRRRAWSCVACGDCIQDHLSFPGCTQSLCYKELRNGPCGGSRTDGSCEVGPTQRCIWNVAYLNTIAAGEDPTKFARTLIPPRDWTLNRTNALANRLAGIDSYSRRRDLGEEEENAQ